MNADHQYFLKEQTELINIVKAYKNSPEFKKLVDNDPRAIFKDGLAGFDGEVEIFWNDADNFYLPLPINQNIGLDDEAADRLGVAGAKEGYYRAVSDGSTYKAVVRGGVRGYTQLDAFGSQSAIFVTTDIYLRPID